MLNAFFFTRDGFRFRKGKLTIWLQHVRLQAPPTSGQVIQTLDQKKLALPGMSRSGGWGGRGDGLGKSDRCSGDFQDDPNGNTLVLLKTLQ